MPAAVKDEKVVSFSSPERLHKIDQLRAKNVGTHMPLPQLVVVGDQSSGKSSLLETLTGIPFPNAQGLCTRYATQITHRRDDVQDVSVTIIPGPYASNEQKQRLLSYHRSVESTAQLQQEFESILNEVNTLMGIRSKDNLEGKDTFSRDVLKIEKCGPNEDYLTVIDVPGIFRNTEDGVTTEADKSLVLDMVKGYIEQERTIILAVLPCTVDVATQEILNLAASYDEAGERTLGVLTKPDLLHERSTKATVCELINGEKRPLKLGYYVVVNRGADEDARDGICTERREDMFKQDPWRHLPADRVGIVALRERLQDLLGYITDKAFPKLRAQARAMLADCEKSLDSLGPSRQTRSEQQIYLCELAGRFQRIVRDALDANYSSHPELGRDDLRLITDIVNVSERFNQDFIKSAHAYEFEALSLSEPEEDTTSVQKKAIIQEPEQEPDGADFPELDSIIDTTWQPGAPKGGILEWIDRMYYRSRGLDLGTFSSSILSSAFREQSASWESATTLYVSKVILIIHRFITAILENICSDAKIRDELTSTMEQDLTSSYKNAMKQALFLVRVERDQRSYTLKQDFNAAVHRSSGLRTMKPFEDEVKEENTDMKRSNGLSIQDIKNIIGNQDKGQHKRETIHDLLAAYYNIARERFVDTLFRQAVGHCLLTGPRSPLLLFSEKWVLKLDETSLESVAGEARMVTGQRDQLKKKIEDLESALKILR